MMKSLGSCLLLLAIALPAQGGLLGEEWTQREFRGQVELGEIVWPIFNEKGHINGGAKLMIGLAWRALDPAEMLSDPDADGLKPIGLFGGISFDITDPFDFMWVQFTAGATVEEVVSLGQGLYIGNATKTILDETGQETSVVVPGLDCKMKTVFGLGLSADPD